MEEEKKSLISVKEIACRALEFSIIVLAVIGLIFVVGFVSILI
jgi:hypothetical protein